MPSEQAQEFFRLLSDLGLLVGPGEAIIIARTHRDTRRRLTWVAVLDVCATRAAHKKGIS